MAVVLPYMVVISPGGHYLANDDMTVRLREANIYNNITQYQKTTFNDTLSVLKTGNTVLDDKMSSIVKNIDFKKAV